MFPDGFWSAPEWRQLLLPAEILAAMLVLETLLILRIRHKVRTRPSLPRPDLPWTFADLGLSTLAALPFLALAFGLVFQEMRVWMDQPAGIAGMLTDVSTLRLMLGTALATDLAASAVVLYRGRVRHDLPWSGMGFWFPGVREALVRPLLWIAGFLFFELCYEQVLAWQGIPLASQLLVDLIGTSRSPGDKLFVVLTAGILIPVLEEFLFRGFLFPLFTRYVGLGWGMAISTFLFAVAHLEPVPGGWIQNALSLPLFLLLGLLLCWLFHRSGSLLPAIVAHAANNLLQVLILLHRA